MGSRANYILVTVDGYRLFYSHWGAKTVIGDVIAGPVAAERFITRQREVSADEWLDDLWCEGSLLLDPISKVLFINNGYLEYGFDELRVVDAVVRRTWPGWELRWAVDGSSDLRAYLGLPPVPRSRDGLRDGVDELRQDTREAFLTVTVIENDRTNWYTSPGYIDADSLFAVGPSLLGSRRLADPPASDPALCTSDTTALGLHFDSARKRAWLWSATSLDGGVQLARQTWPDWDWTIWGTDPAPHELAADGAVRVVRKPIADTVRRVRSLVTPARVVVPDIDAIPASTIAPAKTTVQLNPLFSTHQDVAPTEDERAAVHRALDELALS